MIASLAIALIGECHTTQRTTNVAKRAIEFKRRQGRHRVAVALIGAVILQTALVPAAVAQTGVAPRVFIEGFRVTDSTTRRAAADVRAILPNYVSQSALAVMPSNEIQAYLDRGEPDDFGFPWNWADLRKLGPLYRVDEIVDILATVSPNRVALHASLLRPLLTGAIVPLATVTATTVHEAARLLAKQLSVDSVLLRPEADAPVPIHRTDH